MARIISKCPGCAGMLHITTLRCPDCGMELKQNFALTEFDKLTDAEYAFLMTFLRQRGISKMCKMSWEFPTPQQRKDWMNC